MIITSLATSAFVLLSFYEAFDLIDTLRHTDIREPKEIGRGRSPIIECEKPQIILRPPAQKIAFRLPPSAASPSTFSSRLTGQRLIEITEYCSTALALVL